MSPAKENTWRALTGEDAVIPWACRFSYHKWTVWKEEPHQFAGKNYLKMVRHCAGCNLPEVKLVKIPQWL